MYQWGRQPLITQCEEEWLSMYSIAPNKRVLGWNKGVNLDKSQFLQIENHVLLLGGLFLFFIYLKTTCRWNTFFRKKLA